MKKVNILRCGLLVVLISAFCVTYTSCLRKKNEFRSVGGYIWGTTYHIVYRSADDLTVSIEETMQQIDSVFSTFNPESEVSRINRGDSVKASKWLRQVLRVSRSVYDLSGEVFDPTVAPLVRLWGFGADTCRREPTLAQIDSARQKVGLYKAYIDRQGYYKGPELDFAAIAKGFGVDCVADVLRRAGVRDFMVEIGGEVVTRGVNPHGRPWLIQVDAPVVSGTEHRPYCTVALSGEALATSGNYRNTRLLESGQRVWHTISPRTGLPVTFGPLSVTVMAPDCTWADALATAAMAMPATQAERMLRKLPGVKALIITTDDNGALQAIDINGFRSK